MAAVPNLAGALGQLLITVRVRGIIVVPPGRECCSSAGESEGSGAARVSQPLSGNESKEAGLGLPRKVGSKKAIRGGSGSGSSDDLGVFRSEKQACLAVEQLYNLL
eukprot:762852-Hanusia_phi.AAC.1